MSLVLMHLSIVTPNMGSTYKVTPVVGLLTQVNALGNTLIYRVGLLFFNLAISVVALLTAQVFDTSEYLGSK